MPECSFLTGESQFELIGQSSATPFIFSTEFVTVITFLLLTFVRYLSLEFSCLLLCARSCYFAEGKCLCCEE